MAKRRAKKLTIDDLVELANQVGLSEDAFDGDLRDACDDEAQLIFENLKSSSFRERMEFLHLHGFGLGRLADLIREFAEDDKEKPNE